MLTRFSDLVDNHVTDSDSLEHSNYQKHCPEKHFEIRNIAAFPTGLSITQKREHLYSEKYWLFLVGVQHLRFSKALVITSVAAV